MMRTAVMVMATAMAACGQPPTDDTQCAQARELLTSCGLDASEWQCDPDAAIEVLGFSCDALSAWDGGKHDGLLMLHLGGGKRCVANFQCDADLVCRHASGNAEHRTCEPRGAGTFDPCDGDNDCTSGSCEDDACTRKCKPNELLCERDEMLRCTADGKGVEREKYCLSGYTSCEASTGQCRCTPGTIVCGQHSQSGLYEVQRCDENGIPQTEQTCSRGDRCSATKAACVDARPGLNLEP